MESSSISAGLPSSTLTCTKRHQRSHMANQKGPREFLAFLQTRRAGDVVTEAEVLSAVPSWKKSTLDTHRRKHKLDRFIAPLEGNTFRVAQDGTLITEADINAALS